MIETPEVKKLTEYIIKKASRLGYSNDFVKKGLDEAKRLHGDQLRKSGEPYIIHPLAVAKEILDIDLGEDALVAALLHDTIEDCNIDGGFLKKEFNEVVARLVEGVTKIDNLAHNSNKRYTEILNVRKLIIAAADDVRVLLIKLSDRLNNMRTIEALKPERQVEYADETLKVYVPLAEYIGIGKWKRELEDISFRKKEPEINELLAQKISEDKRVKEHLLDQLLIDIRKVLKNRKLKIDEVFGRTKSTHSTYNKLEKQVKEGKLFSIENTDISKIKDLIAVSIIVNSDEIECYRVLGMIHGHYEHSSHDFDDYIASPKPNGFRALQTTIFYQGERAEIQIKTTAMHDVNEFGPASHLAYKLSGKRNAKATNQFGWIRNLSLWSGKERSEESFKVKAFEDKIYVITPKGRVIELHKGSTPIDFAYAIHTEVGNKFIGVKINDQIGKVDTVLQNGDVVDIITSKNTKKPSLEWLQHAFSNSTKQKIRHYLTLHEKEVMVQKGKEAITEYVLKYTKVDWLTIDSGIIKYLCGELGAPDIDHLYIGIYHGNLSKKDVLKLLIKKLNLSQTEDLKAITKDTKQSTLKTHSKKVIIEGATDLEFMLAGCCKPLSGDEIIGIVTLRDGLKIHRKVCPNLLTIESQRILNAEWE